MNFADAGALIRESRRRAGLTQAELAKRPKLSRAAILPLESGTTQELGIGTLAQVVDRLGLELTVQPKHARLTLHEAYALTGRSGRGRTRRRTPWWPT